MPPRKTRSSTKSTAPAKKRASTSSAAKGKGRTSAKDGGDRLDEYVAKRDFSKTPEPSGRGGPPAARGNRFVVQRHRARRLHYDFRLEMGGVLASWAVPKGLSLDPAARRLGVHVEDHPVEYFDFEGVIPKGEYGGGDVIVWDWGTYEAVHADDPVKAVADGELHLDLYGEKLRGRFVLIRRGEDRSGKEQWLVFHKRDEHAVAGWDAEDHPRSVRSGRTNDEVAASRDAVWHGDAPAETARVDFSTSRDDIARLDALGDQGAWEFDGVELRLTNLDKVLFPPRAKGDDPLTKRDLIRYYATIAPVMLPYLEGRPLNMHRYPNGVGKPGFWHKEVPSHAPEWITRWHNDEADEGETEWYIVADRPATLAWLANFGAIELHAWTSRIPDVHDPTYALIDVDPGETTPWEDVVTLARLYRTALGHLGVFGAPKLTGQRGIQVWVPIEPGPTFGDTRAWVEEISRAIGRTVPQLVSWKWEKRERGGLARLDYTQNAINKTLVAPYSVRPSPGAPVSMPMRWEELDDPELRSDRWTVRDAGARLVEVGDLFTPVLTRRQSLPPIDV
ncbi:MAG TPA: non-homologous end-joining DNA ligase [Acidimicrobiia bacterium]|jgi:bifunctional non-homologous end joining protein LigD